MTLQGLAHKMHCSSTVYLQCDSAISGFGLRIQKCNVLKEEMSPRLFCILHWTPLYFLFAIYVTIPL